MNVHEDPFQRLRAVGWPAGELVPYLVRIRSSQVYTEIEDDSPHCLLPGGVDSSYSNGRSYWRQAQWLSFGTSSSSISFTLLRYEEYEERNQNSSLFCEFPQLTGTNLSNRRIMYFNSNLTQHTTFPWVTSTTVVDDPGPIAPAAYLYPIVDPLDATRLLLYHLQGTAQYTGIDKLGNIPAAPSFAACHAAWEAAPDTPASNMAFPSGDYYFPAGVTLTNNIVSDGDPTNELTTNTRFRTTTRVLSFL